ncbi:hypothetical protein D3C84_843980 [compost metagenome]
MPTIANEAASAPLRLSVSEPSASSVMAISATLIPTPTTTFSLIAVVVLLKLTAVGASLTSLILSVKFCEASGLPPTVGSLAFTVTL